MLALTREEQKKITPKQALNRLVEGNARFVSNLRVNRNLLDQVKQTSEAQYPFAIVLSCIDSRTSSELIFDQGIGDIFSVRIAGNVLNDDILGSMEFASKVAGAKLIMVLGHSQCGAVKGACDGVEMGHLSTLLSKIKPAVDGEDQIKENRNSQNNEFVNRVTLLNVQHNVHLILERSAILRSLCQEGQLGIVGGVHNLESGAVDLCPATQFVPTDKLSATKHYVDFSKRRPIVSNPTFAFK